jgi:hypothetical protein
MESYAPQAVDAEWTYLRANLDHPRSLLFRRLAATFAGLLGVDPLQRPEPRPELKLLARLQLGAHQVLHLVETQGQQILVSTSQQGSPTLLALASDSVQSLSFHHVRPAATMPSASEHYPSALQLPSVRAAVSRTGTGVRPARKPGAGKRVSW